MNADINPLDKMKELNRLGFTSEYTLSDDCLLNTKTKKKYRPQDVQILSEYRFEGYTNPSDMSILYVIETEDGDKGQVMVSYAPTADSSIHNFMMEATEKVE